MVVCTQTSVVTPEKRRCDTPRRRRIASMSVPKKAPFPGLCTTTSPSRGCSSSMIALPGSPRTSTRPRDGSSVFPIAEHRRFFDGGQSCSSLSCASNVCTIVSPAPLAAASSRAVGATAACSRFTSFPSESPKPPTSKKSRCQSIITSASAALRQPNGLGLAVGTLSAKLPRAGGEWRAWGKTSARLASASPNSPRAKPASRARRPSVSLSHTAASRG
mmetsp:Transcript_19622/g.47016  ORF Transcript_19622/g.47016 Transcript_19622/m.47016 type:complete len:218 (-) Transcript_19622:415-1068(-)